MIRWCLALLGALASVLAAVGVVVASWQQAARHGTDQRLRLLITADRPIPAWTVVASDILRRRLARVANGFAYVQTPQVIVGRYAGAAIPPDTPIVRDSTVTVADTAVPSGGAVVSVEVSTDHVSNLAPGMALAFAKKDDMLPTAADLAKKDAEPAFTLLAIAPSPRSAGATSLIVAVPACRLAMAGRLGTDTWRPVRVRR